MKFSKIQLELRVALLYALFGGLWILLSDRFLASIVTDITLLTQIQSYKGWTYVALSTILIFLLMRRELVLRRRAQAELLESEEKYRTLIEVSKDAILINQNKQITYLNPACVKLLGAESPEQIIGKTPFEIFPPGYHNLIQTRIDAMLEASISVPTIEEKIVRLDGREVDVDVSASPFMYDGAPAIQVVMRDITKRKLAEKLLGETQEQLRLAVETANVGLWDWDLRTNQINFSPQWKRQIGHEIHEISHDFSEWESRVHPEDVDNAVAKLNEYLENPENNFENVFRFQHKDGSYRWILAQANLIRDDAGTPVQMLGSHIDITDRKRSEEIIRQSEEKLKNIIQHSNSMFYSHTADQILTYVSPQSRNILDCEPLEAMVHWQDFLSDSPANQFGVETTELAIETGQRQPPYELELITRKGRAIWVRVDESPVVEKGQTVAIVGSLTDITLHKQAEDSLKQYTQQLETLNTVSTSLTTSLSLDKVLELILDQVKAIMPIDSATIFMAEERGLRIVMIRGLSPSNIGRIFPKENIFFEEMERTREPIILNDPSKDPDFKNWGDDMVIQSWMGVPLFVRDRLIGFMTLDSNKLQAYSEEQIPLLKSFAAQAAQAIENARQFSYVERLLERLSSLRQIDQAITGSLDLRVTLNVLIKHVRRQLDVDAASILLYYPESQTLELTESQGFLYPVRLFTRFRLGQDYSGLVALERRVIHFPDLDKRKTDTLYYTNFRQEGFAEYIGVPLTAKGQITGVMEIYNRRPIYPESEWFDFLKTLAGQAAIAIDNISLYNNLQRSNSELIQAYDATIEGWARALELRDMETEGHSRRVVYQTMELARKMGLNGELLSHIYRGALLHDIGKMGIPDAILQKPDSLSDEEWEVMKHHPEYAFDWLSSISYLQPALDIPYCHHEKWDGTGYPRGLQSQEIPLAARIFAIVDVFDALSSNRPYRDAWPKDKIIAYIKEQSGKQFDPAVVNAFLEMREEQAGS